MPSLIETCYLLKTHIQILQGHFFGINIRNNALLKESLILTYHTKTLSELNECLVIDDASTIHNQKKLLKTLEKFLAHHWACIKNTLVCYTALPQSEITSLLIEVAFFVAEELNNHRLNKGANLHALHLLMPGLSMDSLKNEYPDLTTITTPHAVKTILSSHCLGQGGLYLIPVNLLVELDVSKTQQIIPNIYFDYEHHSNDMVNLTAEECQRLESHSALTRELIDAKKDYETYLNNDSTLLGQLRQLSFHLRFNSIQGIGRETNAGAGAYAAIIRFSDYYKSFVDQEIIPAEVRNELNLLLELSSNPEKNQNATQNVQTCIATRRLKLDQAMKGHEAALNISLGKECQQQLMEQARQRFEHAQTKLKEVIAKNAYEGQDNLPLTQALLKHLHINFTIESKEDLQQISMLTADEIRVMFSQSSLQKGVLNHLKTLEDWVMFSIDISANKLEALVSVLADELRKNVFKKRWVGPFLSWLGALDNEYGQALVKALQPALISTVTHFHTLMSPFLRLRLALPDQQQRATIFAGMQNSLPLLMNTSAGVKLAFSCLTDDQKDIVFTAVQNNLVALIKTADDLDAVMINLTPSQRNTIFEQIKPSLKHLIKSIDNLKNIFNHLTIEHQAQVFVIIEDNWLSFIKVIDDVQSIICHLDAEFVDLIFIKLQAHFRSLIKNADGLNKLHDYITTDLQREILFSALFADNQEARLDSCLSMIRTAQDFKNVWACFNERQRRLLFKSYQANFELLSHLIITGDDLLDVLQYLTVEERQFILKCLIIDNKYWPPMQSIKQVSQLLSYVEMDYYKLILWACADSKQFSQLMQGKEAIEAFFSCLKPEQKMHLVQIANTNIQALKSFQQTLRERIDSAKKLGQYLADLSSQLTVDILINYKNNNQLALFFNEAKDIVKLLRPLSKEQREIVWFICQEVVLPLLETPQDIGEVLKGLRPEELPLLLNHYQEELKQVTYFKTFLSYLRSEQKTAFLILCQRKYGLSLSPTQTELSAILCLLNFEQNDLFLSICNQKNLLQLISSISKFKGLMDMRARSLEQKRAIYMYYQAHFTEHLLKTANFSTILTTLTLEQCAIFLDTYQNKLPELIPDVTSLEGLLKQLNNEKHPLVSTRWRIQSSQSINDVASFNQLLGCLNTEQQKEVLTICYAQLALLLKNSDDLCAVLGKLTMESRTFMLTTCPALLRQLITSCDDLQKVLNALTNEQMMIVLNAWQPELPNFLQDKVGLGLLLGRLNIHNFKTIVTTYQQQLAILITTPAELGTVMSQFPYYSFQERCQILLSLDTVNFLAWMVTPTNLGQVLGCLMLTQFPAFLNSPWVLFKQIVVTALDLNAVVRHLNEEQFQLVWDFYQTPLPMFVPSLMNIGQLLFCVHNESISEFILNTYAAELEQCIQSYDDLAFLLTTTLNVSVVWRYASKILEFITTHKQLRTLLSPLSIEQCQVILQLCQPLLASLIKDGFDFGDVVTSLSANACYAMIIFYKESMDQFMDSFCNFSKVVRQLNGEQQLRFFKRYINLVQSLPELNVILSGVAVVERPLYQQIFKEKQLEEGEKILEDVAKKIEKLQTTSYYEYGLITETESFSQQIRQAMDNYQQYDNYYLFVDQWNKAINSAPRLCLDNILKATLPPNVSEMTVIKTTTNYRLFSSFEKRKRDEDEEQRPYKYQKL